MEEDDDNACVGENGEVYSVEDMYKTVRELLGNNRPEQEIKIFMRSEMFREVFPHWHEAFNSMERRVLEKMRVQTLKSLAIKQGKQDKDGEEAMSSKQAAAIATVKSEAIVGSSDAEKLEKVKSRPIHSDSSSDSESEERRHRKKVKHKKHHHHQKKKVRALSSNSSSSGSSHVKIIKKERDDIKIKVKKEKEDSELGASKIHPFYLQDTSAIIQPKGKLVNGNPADDSEHERRRKKKSEESKHKKKSHHHHHSKQQPPPPPRPPEPKGKSYYNPSSAKAIEHGRWKPFEDSEFSKHEKSFKLGGLSILCVDLTKMNNIFYNPAKGNSSQSATATPLKPHMIIPEKKADEIERLEARKRNAYEPKLRKLYRKNVKNRHHSHNAKKESAGNKSTKDQRQKGLEQLREKAEQKNKMTRKLPWENKEFFDKKKPTRPQTAEKKESSNQKSNKTAALAKIPKIHAPGTSMQAILQQISTANEEAANKPKVELKIPKLSALPYSFKKQPAQKSVTGGLVAAEVDKLLRSNTTVQCPTMTTSPSDLAEYTIRKIGWWLLKEEQDPPDEVLYHPELHDNEIYEDWYDPDDHRDDDDISVGCVSDPEGTEEPVAPVGGKPEKPDPDKLDEYAGLATLESRIPRISAEIKPGKTIQWLRFIKTKAGTNYEKSNFEAKCYLCNGEVVKGRRQLGAHFRSDHHKDAFRNYSLKLAKYEEVSLKVQAKKIFVAKLVQYTTDDYAVVPATSDIPKDKDALSKSPSLAADVENDILVPDSPRAIIDSNHGSPDAAMVRLRDLDEVLSLPSASLALYDLEQDAQQLRAKICLRTNGLWTAEMEKRWLVMQDKETRMTEEYNEVREQYINAPDSHPLKNSEWIKFWERRCSEVEAQGKNPDDMDFGGEWVPFWLKRVQEIMKADIEAKMLKMKQELGLDAPTLIDRCHRHGFSPNSDPIGGNPGNRTQSNTSGDKTINQSLPAQPIQVIGTPFYSSDGQRVIQLMNQLASIDMSIPPPPPPPRLPQTENFDSHYNKNSKDQKHLKDNHRETQRERDKGKFGRGGVGNRYDRNNRKREYRRSPPPKHFGNNNKRRPSNSEKYSNQNPSAKVSSPESDWETEEPQNKLAKSSNTANQHSKSFNPATRYPENRRPSYNDNQPNTKHSTNIPESYREKEPQQKVMSAYNNTSVGNHISAQPNHRRTSYDDNRRKPWGSGNKTSPESDWEKEPVQTLGKPSTNNPVQENFSQKYSGNYNPGFPHGPYNKQTYDKNRLQQHVKTVPSPESDWENKSTKSKSPIPAVEVHNMNEHQLSSRKEKTTTGAASNKPDLNLLLAELQDAIAIADPILSAPKISSHCPEINTLEPILSDDDANDIPYSPASVLSDNDPFRGVSPINSIEMSVEMTPIEDVAVDVDTSRLEKSPKCDKSPKRNKTVAVVNPSSPEEGEIDSPRSSVCLDPNNVSSFIECFNQDSANNEKSSFCPATAAAEMDKNSLGYQLYLNQSRNAACDSSNHRSSKETSVSTNPNSKDRSKIRGKDIRHDNPWL